MLFRVSIYATEQCVYKGIPINAHPSLCVVQVTAMFFQYSLRSAMHGLIVAVTVYL